MTTEANNPYKYEKDATVTVAIHGKVVKNCVILSRRCLPADNGVNQYLVRIPGDSHPYSVAEDALSAN